VVTSSTTLPDALLPLAMDLSASLARDDRYRRLLDALCAVVPCDAACLLAVDGQTLVPVAARGLTSAASSRRYSLEEPRFSAIARAEVATVFPADSRLPDPFEGLIAADPTGGSRIHACLGCPLRIDGELVGLLAADALAPGAFDDLDRSALSWISALAAAAMRTGRLIEALEASARKSGLVAADLMRAETIARGGGILGQSPAIDRLRSEIAIAGPSDVTVLISGETGTGKELVARAIHAQSGRRSAPILYLNCAALPDSVAESELFGHVRGAFTGAESARAGKFEVADGGTLFLDEIGELSQTVQPKLLRAIQEGEIQRVGSDRVHSVDVRLIAATNRDLVKEIAAGRFRADLFHRLAAYPIEVSPLRDRPGDASLLASVCCDRARVQLGLGRISLAPDALVALEAHRWPGNVRELENVIFRAVLRAAAGVERGSAVILDRGALGPELDVIGELVMPAAPESASDPPSGIAGPSLREQVDDFQRVRILDAVAASGGNWAAAARALSMHRSNLHHLAKRLGLISDG